LHKRKKDWCWGAFRATSQVGTAAAIYQAVFDCFQGATGFMIIEVKLL